LVKVKFSSVGERESENMAQEKLRFKAKIQGKEGGGGD
jgi:hypothetical protein